MSRAIGDKARRARYARLDCPVLLPKPECSRSLQGVQQAFIAQDGCKYDSGPGEVVCNRLANWTAAKGPHVTDWTDICEQIVDESSRESDAVETWTSSVTQDRAICLLSFIFSRLRSTQFGRSHAFPKGGHVRVHEKAWDRSNGCSIQQT